MFWLKNCPHCGGDLYEDSDPYGRYIACLQCGRYLNYPEAAQPKRPLKGRPAFQPALRRRAGQEMTPQRAA